MALFPNRTVVINLDRRTDRRATFERNWAASGWADVVPEPVRFSAVDGFAGLTRRQIPAWLRGQPGVYGCWASHIQVLKDAIADEVAAVMILEDDVVLPPASATWFQEVLTNVPFNVDALWLDGTYLGEDNRLSPGKFGSMNAVRAPLRTHAYILKVSAAARMLPALEAWPGPIDRFYARSPARPNVYVAVPSLAAQAGDDTDIGSRWAELTPSPDSGTQGAKDALWLRRLSPRS